MQTAPLEGLNAETESVAEQNILLYLDHLFTIFHL